MTEISRWPLNWIYQPASLLGCVGLGWIAHAVVSGLVPLAVPVLVRIGIGAVLYAVPIGGFVYAAPGLTGLSRAELVADARRVAQRVGEWRNG